MIVDLRTYNIHPGKLPAYLDLYGREGYAIQTKHLGDCLGYWVAEVGVQNRVVHLWAYPDIAERARRRAAMESDPAWNGYRAKSAEFLQRQDNCIVRPAPFWPLAQQAAGPIAIVDYRIYTLHPGKLGEYFKRYEAEGLTKQVGYLGRCIGYYQSDIGTQSQVISLWAYESVEDRARRRARLQADPGWSGYLAGIQPYFVFQETALLRPAPFWTPKF
ncbi:MAG: NIPSNAP family protein [Pseudomonadota bacterium]